MQDEVKITESGNDLIAALTCELDHHTSRRVREIIDKQVFATRPGMLVLDFSAVHFMDSSGIALIVKTGRLMKEQGGRVWIENPSNQPRRVIDASGIDRLIPVAINK